MASLEINLTKIATNRITKLVTQEELKKLSGKSYPTKPQLRRCIALWNSHVRQTCMLGHCFCTGQKSETCDRNVLGLPQGRTRELTDGQPEST